MKELLHTAAIVTALLSAPAWAQTAAQRALLDAELRLASLRKVVEKRRSDFALQQQRRDQKQTDERAALQYRNVGQEN